MTKKKQTDLLKAAKAAQTVKAEAAKTESGQADNAPEDKPVNMCVKVPRSHRTWWMTQARMRDSTLTAEIVGFLTEKYGLPEDQ